VNFQYKTNRVHIRESLVEAYYGFNTLFRGMQHTATYLLNNSDIEDALTGSGSSVSDKVDDLFRLRTLLSDLSNSSRLSRVRSNRCFEYEAILVVPPESSLYGVASEHFTPASGVYKQDDGTERYWWNTLFPENLTPSNPRSEVWGREILRTLTWNLRFITNVRMKGLPCAPKSGIPAVIRPPFL
jgi:hypothetical protein